jgi:hypothetical protein
MDLIVLPHRNKVAAVLGLGWFGLISAAAAAGLPDQFTLGRFVPKDVWFYVHAVHNPEREWIDAQWAEVLEAVRGAGIDREIAELFLSALGPERRQELEPKLERMLNALRSVQWSELCGREFVMAQRLSTCSRRHDYIMLVRAKADSADRNFAAISAFLKELSTAGPGIRAVELNLEGVQRISLQFSQKEALEMTGAVELFRHGDVIGFSTGERSANDVIAMITGQARDDSLVADSRFQQAVQQVERPTDSLVFFDGKRFVGDLRAMVEAEARHHAKQEKQCEDKTAGEPSHSAHPSAEVAQKLRLLKDAFSYFDIIDYTVESTTTTGRKERSDSVIMFQPGKRSSPLASCFLDRRPFEKFDRFIPAEAKSFSLSGGLDLQRLYHLVLSFITEHIPQAAGVIAQVHAKLAEKGFDLERDFFSWWSGETISIELPAAMITPMGSSDSVTMIRVKDPKLAAAKVNDALQFIVAKLKMHGQVLSVAPAAMKEDGFHEITYPALAMFLRPIVGVHEDWLIIGTSAPAINKCLAVHGGEAPSIAKSQKFAEEGLTPKGPVLSVKFEDLSGLGHEMAAVVGMVGTFGQMALMQIPEKNAEAKKFKQFAQSLLRIATKLGPVLQKIDFYSSSAAVATQEGDSAVRFTSVTTYRLQPAVANKTK